MRFIVRNIVAKSYCDAKEKMSRKQDSLGCTTEERIFAIECFKEINDTADINYV